MGDISDVGESDREHAARIEKETKVHVKLGAVAVGGVFDGLHAGHLALLSHGASVAAVNKTPFYAVINDMMSLRTLSRTTQHSEEQRCALIKAVIPGVIVVTFKEPTPRQALEKIAAQREGFVVFFKGEDALPDLTFNSGAMPNELLARNVVCGYLPVTPAQGSGGSKLGTRGTR